MQLPLVVDALREQLVRVLDWYGRDRPAFRWGVVIHPRSDRGHPRFGAVTPRGESLVLTEPLLRDLAAVPCWLDGAVAVRLEVRATTGVPRWARAFRRDDRPAVVEAFAVHFDAEPTPDEVIPAMSGIVTPRTCLADLFFLTRSRPRGWPA